MSDRLQAAWRRIGLECQNRMLNEILPRRDNIAHRLYVSPALIALIESYQGWVKNPNVDISQDESGMENTAAKLEAVCTSCENELTRLELIARTNERLGVNADIDAAIDSANPGEI